MTQADAFDHRVGGAGLQREGAFGVFAVVDRVFQIVLVECDVDFTDVFRVDAVGLGTQGALGGIDLEVFLAEQRNLAAFLVDENERHQLVTDELLVGVASGQVGEDRVNDPQLAQTSHG